MMKVTGNVASDGIALGIIKELQQEESVIVKIMIEDIVAERQRFDSALQKAVQQLDDLYQIALEQVGEESATIFQVHKMMAEDEEYTSAIIQMIEGESVNAEHAVFQAGESLAQVFASIDDEYMKERAVDVKDISGRIVAVLQDKGGTQDLEEPCIVVADDLTPSETIQMDKSKILAFVTRKGSVNSHTAILARMMAIPAIVGAEYPEDIDGAYAIVDGFKGELVIEPTGEEIAIAREVERQELEKKELLNAFKGKATITKSGKKIKLYANIGSVDDVKFALENDAEGIGLFRSEFLYLEQSDFPSEELQFQAYKQVAEKMEGKRVIIRTLDIGADKQIDYFQLDKEENPALGYRAVRICLKQEEIFRTQLRALVRASAFGKIAIMVPMICSEWEVKRVKEILEEVKAELAREGVEFDEIEFGIMIETPAAVMVAPELAELVDFFSIGTNDLTQYTLALDRQNEKLNTFYDAHHPAVLRMIRMVVEAGHAHNTWVGICGELGADLELTETFIEYGVDELSVSPAAILATRKAICEAE